MKQRIANFFASISANIQVVTAVGAVLGFSISTWIQIYYMNKTLETTTRSNSIIISRELVDKFGQTDVFARIEESIVRGETLYQGVNLDRGGKYSWHELNAYLGFFEEVANYKKLGGMELGIVDALFGAHMLEAYLDADIRDYVLELRTKGGQPDALIEFQKLSEEIIRLPSRSSHIEEYQTEFKTWGF